MNGRIEQLTPEKRTGMIRAEDNSRIAFSASAVEGREFGFLILGQHVVFDLESGYNRQNAARVRADLPVRRRPGSPEPVMQLQYVGFDQSKNVREYRFEGVRAGAATRLFVVSADMALFLRHRIGMQDGPTLCLRILSAELGTPVLDPTLASRRELSDEDMTAFLSARPVPTPRKSGRRKFKRNPPAEMRVIPGAA